MKVLAITATAGRHTLLERVVGMFLQQDYKNKHLLIWQNSPVAQELDKNYPNITLVNNHLNTKTGERYKTLGEIYNDIADYIFYNEDFVDFDLLYHQDDDDAFLQNHISEGVKGFLKGGKKAYKPERSYYAHPNGVDLVGNNLEPSVFVTGNQIFIHGYSDESVAHHLQWFNPLLDEREMFIDPKGEPTLIYDWQGFHHAFKTSGNPNHPTNFQNYHDFSQDHGDKVITPWSKEQVEQEFKRIFKK